jgi:hypothetical protein
MLLLYHALNLNLLKFVTHQLNLLNSVIRFTEGSTEHRLLKRGYQHWFVICLHFQVR